MPPGRIPFLRPLSRWQHYTVKVDQKLWEVIDYRRSQRYHDNTGFASLDHHLVSQFGIVEISVNAPENRQRRIAIVFRMYHLVTYS